MRKETCKCEDEECFYPMKDVIDVVEKMDNLYCKSFR